MPKYRYVGRDVKGQSCKGEIDAGTKDLAVDLILKKRITPIEITLCKEKSKGLNELKIPDFLQPKIDLSDLIVFSRQLHSLTKAGIPIMQAITGLAHSGSSHLLRDVLLNVNELMQKGITLSAAMAEHPRVFPQLYLALVQVGENTGRLDVVFLQLSKYLEQEMVTKQRIKAAMRYPSFVLIALVIAVVILNIYVIPIFSSMFAKFDAELPWTTQVLLSTSSFFVNYWIYLIIISISSVIGFKAWIASEKGGLIWDKRKLKFPIVGSVIERSLLARFSRSFSMMLSSGVPLNNALVLVANAVDNHFIKSRVLSMRTAIESGESLTKAATATELFPSLILQMIAVGEETGQVDDLLNEAADFYEREVDYDLNNLTAKIEPILISIVAGMVLILALGIFTPMWDMMSTMKGG